MTRPQSILVGARVLLALCIVGLVVLPAFAHSWYDPECCSAHDCAAVRPHTVTATPGGWLVQLKPGDHFLVKEPIERLVPYADALESQDGSFHVCVVTGWETGQVVRCLYAPPMGF